MSCDFDSNHCPRWLYFAPKLAFQSATSSGVISPALSESITHFHALIARASLGLCSALSSKPRTSGCRKTGVKRIRIHDLRHSHVSLLINMGFTALAIIDHMGHETAGITYRYAHLFPTKQDEMAAALNGARG